MTREQKLALIVGFSLILLVGVLISDHLSRAREARVAAVRPDEIAVVSEPLPVRPDPMRLIPPQQVASAGTQPAPAAPNFAAPSSGGVVPLGDRASADVPDKPFPHTLAMNDAPAYSAAEQLPADEPIEVIAQGRWLNNPPADARSDEDRPLIDQVLALGGKVANGEIHLPAAAGTSRPGMGAVVPPPVVSVTPAASNPLPVAPIRWHTVEKGDSLFTIAKRYYGDGKVWPKLAEHNAGRVGKDGAVRLGVRLQIPPAEALGIRVTEGAKPAAAPAAERPKEPAKQPDRKDAKPTTTRPTYATYTVRKGDTLGEIAQRILGTSKRKDEIVALNRDRIKDENSIRVGMVLKVPAGD